MLLLQINWTFIPSTIYPGIYYQSSDLFQLSYLKNGASDNFVLMKQCSQLFENKMYNKYTGISETFHKIVQFKRNKCFPIFISTERPGTLQKVGSFLTLHWKIYFFSANFKVSQLRVLDCIVRNAYYSKITERCT